MDRVKPITIRDNEKGVEYTLQFNRESVQFTNMQGFRLSDLTDNPEGMLPILFYGAFRMHHKNVSRQKTDDILWNEIAPVPQDFVIRLIDLYCEPRNALIGDETTEEPKNSKMTVEL